MAVRWADRKSASAWTFDEVRRVLTEDPHDQPLGVVMLRDFDTGRTR